MTTLQTSLYFREWGKTRKALIAAGYTSAETDEWRHELHAAALGKDKSSKLFNNRDLDAVLGKFRAISQPDNFDEQIRLMEAEKSRLIHGIEKDSLGDAWLASICRDIWDRTDWRNLPVEELLKLRRRVANARRASDSKIDAPF